MPHTTEVPQVPQQVGAQDDIAQIADQVFAQGDGQGSDITVERVPLDNEPQPEQQDAVYHSEDRDLAQPAGESHPIMAAAEDNDHVDGCQCHECKDGAPPEGVNTSHPRECKCGLCALGDDLGKMLGLGSVEAKWQVHALGEAQQPGGVGATQEHNPVVDGPNPNGPDFADNAGNSYEHEVALTRWVDAAVDMLNRGEDPHAVLAKLAHDGCPDPEAVLARALEQPTDQPVTDEASAAPEAVAPPVEEGSTTVLPQGVQASTSLGELAESGREATRRVKVAGRTGIVTGEFEDLWGRKQVRIALDEGGALTVDPDNTRIDEIETEIHDATSEIRNFIESFPPVGEQDRRQIAGLLKSVRQAKAALAKVATAESFELFQQAVALEASLKEAANSVLSADDIEYLAERPAYSVGAVIVDQASMGHAAKSSYFLDDEVAEAEAHVASIDWQKEIRETAPIMAHEASTDYDTAYADASQYITSKVMPLERESQDDIRDRFLASFKSGWAQRSDDIPAPEQKTASAETDDDGPAEGLFL